ncbi:unnamed protein product [Phaeothamnion confervicola]
MCKYCVKFFDALELDLDVVDAAFAKSAAGILRPLTAPFCWLRGGMRLEHIADAKRLHEAARVNAVALSKLLKKFDKHHGSGIGRAFFVKQTFRRGFLSSARLDEIRALTVVGDRNAAEELFTCPVCLEMPMFRPRALGCGHAVCCECVQQLLRHDAAAACPVCRRAGAARDATRLRAWEGVARRHFPDAYTCREREACRRRHEEHRQAFFNTLRYFGGGARLHEVINVTYPSR